MCEMHQPNAATEKLYEHVKKKERKKERKKKRFVTK
jgi:hypothetical protein